MMNRHVLLAASVLLVGCFQSTTPLGSPTVVLRNHEMVGNWRCTAPTMEVDEFITVAVRVFDDLQLLVEVSEEGSDTDRYRFYPSTISATVIWNGQELRDDQRPGEWVFLAWRQITKDSFGARVVQDDALRGSNPKTKLADLRSRVAEAKIYGEEISCARVKRAAADQ